MSISIRYNIKVCVFHQKADIYTADWKYIMCRNGEKNAQKNIGVGIDFNDAVCGCM